MAVPFEGGKCAAKVAACASGLSQNWFGVWTWDEAAAVAAAAEEVFRSSRSFQIGTGPD